jgi:hypothetical protein
MLKKFTFIFLFIITNTFIFSQDLIIKKDSTKIYCRITGVDSTTIRYILRKNRSEENYSLNKANVLNYYIAKPLDSPKVGSVTRGPRPERFFFGIYGGIANPVGVFAAKNGKDTLSGFAMKGAAVHASFMLKLREIFGVTVMYVYQQNNIDIKEMLKYYQATYGGTFSGTGTPWKAQGFMYGFYFGGPLKSVQDLSCDVNFLVGTPSFEMSKYTITQKVSGNTETVSLGNAYSNPFTFMTTMGLRYRVADKISVSLSVDYFMAKPTFTTLATITTSPNSTQIGVDTYAQYVKTYNIKLGLNYTLRGFEIKKHNEKKS